MSIKSTQFMVNLAKSHPKKEFQVDFTCMASGKGWH